MLKLFSLISVFSRYFSLFCFPYFLEIFRKYLLVDFRIFFSLHFLQITLLLSFFDFLSVLFRKYSPRYVSFPTITGKFISLISAKMISWDFFYDHCYLFFFLSSFSFSVDFPVNLFSLFSVIAFLVIFRKRLSGFSHQYFFTLHKQINIDILQF